MLRHAVVVWFCWRLGFVRVLSCGGLMGSIMAGSDVEERDGRTRHYISTFSLISGSYPLPSSSWAWTAHCHHNRTMNLTSLSCFSLLIAIQLIAKSVKCRFLSPGKAWNQSQVHTRHDCKLPVGEFPPESRRYGCITLMAMGMAAHSWS